MVRERILDALKKTIKSLDLDVEPTLEFPADLLHGDYSANLAMVAAKGLKKNPKSLAEEIVKALGTIDGVSKIEIAGPGFINFYLAREAFAETVKGIDERWGRNEHVKGYKVIVEYSQPNPFKPFHIGHLMSTTVGESVSRLVEYSGAEIFRANYQGDIGPHIARCLWGLKAKGLDPTKVEDLGHAYVAGTSAYEDDPKAKEEIDDINKRLYQNDPDLKKVYDIGRKTSLDRFEEIYRVLGTRFDHYFFESETAPIGMKMVEEGLAKGIFEKSDGAVVYKGEKAGLHTRVFITAKGTPTYETKEFGLAKAKRDLFPYDLNVTTVAVEQDEYFKVVEAALAELMPEMKGRYTHVAFGMLQLTTGKMSSRKGNIITGESLIEDMRVKAFEKMKDRDLGEKKHEIADAVAVAAVKYPILKQGRGKNIAFDPEASLSLEGDSGPYLQYSYVRARSVLQKATGMIYHASSIPEQVPVFERLLPRFPEIVERAAKEYEPHHVTTYLTELASAFNSWYATERIIGTPEEAYKLKLTQAFATTMKNGLWLLGIKAPEKM